MCRGCHRFHEEIVGWNGYDDARQARTWVRLEAMVIAAMTLRIDLFDTEALRSQLQQRKIRFIAHHSLLLGVLPTAHWRALHPARRSLRLQPQTRL